MTTYKTLVIEKEQRQTKYSPYTGSKDILADKYEHFEI